MHPWILTFKFLKCLHFYDGYVSTPKHKLQMIDSQPPRMLNQKKQKNLNPPLVHKNVFVFFSARAKGMCSSRVPQKKGARGKPLLSIKV